MIKKKNKWQILELGSYLIIYTNNPKTERAKNNSKAKGEEENMITNWIDINKKKRKAYSLYNE